MGDSSRSRTTVRLPEQDHRALLHLGTESVRGVKALISFAARDTLDAINADPSVAEELMRWVRAPHRRVTESVNLTSSSDGSYERLMQVLAVIDDRVHAQTGVHVGVPVIARACISHWLATHSTEELLARVGQPYPAAWREQYLSQAS